MATWAWLQGSAISEFTDSDWEVFKREGVKVLEDGADGVTVDWENPETGAHGSIKPLATFMYEGRPCRTTAFRNFSRRGTKGQSVQTVCLQSDGTWKLAPDGTEPDGSGPAAATDGGASE
jgi:surface antigen